MNQTKGLASRRSSVSVCTTLISSNSSNAQAIVYVLRTHKKAHCKINKPFPFVSGGEMSTKPSPNPWGVALGITVSVAAGIVVYLLVERQKRRDAAQAAAAAAAAAAASYTQSTTQAALYQANQTAQQAQLGVYSPNAVIARPANSPYEISGTAYHNSSGYPAQYHLSGLADHSYYTGTATSGGPISYASCMPQCATSNVPAAYRMPGIDFADPTHSMIVHGGSSYTTAPNEDACRVLCQNTPECVGAAYTVGSDRPLEKCYLKTQLDNASNTNNRDTEVLFKPDPDGSGRHVTTRMHGIRYLNADIAPPTIAHSYEECRARCTRNPHCRAFTWNSFSQTCDTKFSAARPTVDFQSGHAFSAAVL